MITPGAAPAVIEGVRATRLWTVRRFSSDESAREFLCYAERFGNYKADRFLKPSQKLIVPHNLLLNEGITEALLLITGGGATPFSNGNARLGVGNGTAPALPNQLGLQGASKVYKTMEATYPQISGTTAVFRSVFGPSDANFDWQEFSLCNGPDEALDENLNRRVQNAGTKANGQTWTLDLSITLS